MKRQQGVTLVEILVSLLILGIGVLGFIGMQMRALGGSSEAYERAQAMAIASDFMERMNAQVNASANLEDPVTSKIIKRTQMIDLYDDAAKWQPWGSSEVPDSSCMTTSCITQVEMANFDINEARFYAGTLLPSGRILLSACPDQPAGSAIVCIFVAWGGTTPTVVAPAAANPPACITTDSVYVTGSRCVVLRVF